MYSFKKKILAPLEFKYLNLYNAWVIFFSLLIITDQKNTHFVHSCKMIFNVRKKLYIKMRCTYLCIQSNIKTTTRMELYTILLKLVCAWPPVLNFTFTKILLSINKIHALPLRYLTSFFNPCTWFSRYKSLSVKKNKIQCNLFQLIKKAHHSTDDNLSMSMLCKDIAFPAQYTCFWVCKL